MKFLLHQLIDATGKASPEREAVCFLNESLSYRDLVTRTNQLANTLVRHGIGRRERVGIYMSKSLNTPVAMYGILKAGAAYVPLDPGLPPERLRFVLQDCGIRCVLADDSRLQTLSAPGMETTGLKLVIGVTATTELPFACIDWKQVWAQPGESCPEPNVIEQDLAYIIYTSGSTGQPKGIMHTHHSGLSFARWAASEYGLSSGDRLSNHAPLHFDLSIFDYFACAVAAATVVVIPEAYTKFPASYSKLISEQRISVLFTVPFALIQLLLHGVLEERDLSTLRWIIFGGEPFPTKHLRELMTRLPHVRFDNMYGPAEVNGVTHYTLPQPPASNDPIPIGSISRIAESLVLDEQEQPVVRGEEGELLVRTPTMMQGYWNRPDLNASVFYQREVCTDYRDIFYRTGDLVRQMEDGSFQFLGRKDRQVKVRGYRVELDEIESSLCSNEAVEEAAAVTTPCIQGSQSIQAAAILRPDVQASPNELISWLKTRLPWYAVPESLSIRDRFPRTSTGKIDRGALRDEILTERGGS